MKSEWGGQLVITLIIFSNIFSITRLFYRSRNGVQIQMTQKHFHRITRLSPKPQRERWKLQEESRNPWYDCTFFLVTETMSRGGQIHNRQSSRPYRRITDNSPSSKRDHRAHQIQGKMPEVQ